MAAATFHMMAGIPSDTRVCPTDMSFRVDVEKMIEKWKAEFGHDLSIRVCVEFAMYEILCLTANIDFYL